MKAPTCTFPNCRCHKGVDPFDFGTYPCLARDIASATDPQTGSVITGQVRNRTEDSFELHVDGECKGKFSNHVVK